MRRQKQSRLKYVSLLMTSGTTSTGLTTNHRVRTLIDMNHSLRGCELSLVQVYLERKKAGEEEEDDGDEHDDDLAPGADDGGALRGGRRRGDLLLQRGIVTKVGVFVDKEVRLRAQDPLPSCR